MSRRLVVITGAGASHDCASSEVQSRRQPPLAKDLFSPLFGDILGQYPLAQAAATSIRRAIDPEAENAASLEDYLREQMRNSTSRPTQRRYREIPLYLQQVLWMTGTTEGAGYTRDPDNYNALLNAVLELDDILFLTLNYDTLLDDRLFLYGPFNSMQSYIAADPQWALVKLHGSVNWGRQLDFNVEEALAVIRGNDEAVGINRGNSPEIARELILAPERLEYAGDIELRLDPAVHNRLFDPGANKVYYPALSVPLGAEDELTCPEEHLNAARERLAGAEELNLLVIGYSGYDKEVLRLLAETDRPLGRLLVANGPAEASEQAAERILRACGPGHARSSEHVFPGGFTEFVNSGRLSEFVDGIS